MAKLCPKCYGEHEIGIICPGRPKARPTIAEVREKIAVAVTAPSSNKPKSAPRKRRQAGVSASKPARASSKKTGDEVPGAKVDQCGQSPDLQQLSKTEFDRNAYQRGLMRERRAAKKLGLTVSEYRMREGTT